MAGNPHSMNTNSLHKQSESEQAKQWNSASMPSTLPQITFPTDDISVRRAARLICEANLTDPLNTLFSLEEIAASVTQQHSSDSITSTTPSLAESSIYQTRTLRRLRSKLEHGAMLVESANFAAVAVWEPPSAVQAHASTLSEAASSPSEPDAAHLPLLASFRRDSQTHRSRIFTAKDQPYWKLTMMARDPARRDKGAVRVLIQALIARAQEEGVPVWCEAGNERARDVYSWMGFEVRGRITTGVGVYDRAGRIDSNGEGVSTWAMVANWPVVESGVSGRKAEGDLVGIDVS